MVTTPNALLYKYLASLARARSDELQNRIAFEAGFEAALSEHLDDLAAAIESCAFDSDSAFDSRQRSFLSPEAQRDTDLYNMSCFALGRAGAAFFDGYGLAPTEMKRAGLRAAFLLALMGIAGES